MSKSKFKTPDARSLDDYCITALDGDDDELAGFFRSIAHRIDLRGAQLEAVKPLYIAINEMLAVLGMEGEINNRHEKTEAVMDALYELDDGVYDVDKFMQSIG